jgi:myo-inositol catabolism protein IolC
MPGYNGPLYILPFDHRSFFTKTLFKKTEGLTEQERAVIGDFKHVIYQGFLLGVQAGVPVDAAAILVDEEYGADIHADAEKRGFINILTTEKSGTELFEFQYGDDFAAHIEAIKPVFAKVLLHYRADGDAEKNQLQLSRLKQLSDWCHAHGRGFLVEPLISPTEQEMNTIGQEKFDLEMRPGLTVTMIEQFQAAGVEPDVWKIEGFDSSDAYRDIVAAARVGSRDEVSVVVLGRSESDEKVEGWLVAGKGIEGVTGFAIGRTIFWDALQAYHAGTISREQASERIGDKYLHFYQVFTQ